MTIDLHIKSVSLKVTENTAVCVFWQRGRFHTWPIFDTFHHHSSNQHESDQLVFRC